MNLLSALALGQQGLGLAQQGVGFAQNLGSLLGGSNAGGGGGLTGGSAGVLGQGLQSIFGLNGNSNNFLAESYNASAQDSREVHNLGLAAQDSGIQRKLREATHTDMVENVKSHTTMLQKTSQTFSG